MSGINSAAAVLGLLDSGLGYGYELKHTYDRWFGARKPLAFGQVYAVLSRFVRDGLIALAGEEAGAGPDRKRYVITPDGRRQVAEWLETPDDPNGHMQSNVFAKVVIALMLGDDAGRLVDMQRLEHLAKMRELTATKSSGDLATVLSCDHALFHIEADLRWLDLTESRLRQLSSEVRS